MQTSFERFLLLIRRRRQMGLSDFSGLTFLERTITHAPRYVYTLQDRGEGTLLKSYMYWRAFSRPGMRGNFKRRMRMSGS